MICKGPIGRDAADVSGQTALDTPYALLRSSRTIPPFAALRAFDAVARLGGIRKASELLQIDHSAVSRHLKNLEAVTKCVLIERTPHGMALTPAGQQYHRRISAAIGELAAATIELIPAEDQKQLRIACMPGFAAQWLAPRLTAFEARNPTLEIALRPTDMMPDIAGYEADIDIWYHPSYGNPLTMPSALQSTELAQPFVIPVASPAYLAAHPPIRTVADLLTHALLHEENNGNWRAWFAAHQIGNPGALPGPRLWHANLTVQAASSGRGIALANYFLAADKIAEGVLVEVGGGNFEHVTLGAYLLVARSDRWTIPPIAHLRRWLTATIAKERTSDVGRRFL